MQFRENKKNGRIYVLHYAGYDKEKRRSIIEQVGTIVGTAFYASPNKVLSADQMKEVDEYLAEKRKEHDVAMSKYRFSEFPERFKSIAEQSAAGAEIKAEWAKSIWESWEILSRELRKQGYTQKGFRAEEKPKTRTKTKKGE